MSHFFDNHELGPVRIPAILLSIYIFGWFLQIGDRVELLGAIRYEFLLGAVLTALSFSVKVSPKDAAATKGIRRSLLTLLAFFIIYTLFSYHREHSTDILIDRVFKFSLVTLFISRLVNNTNELKVVLAGFLLAMCKISQEGYHGILTGGLIWENQGIPRLHGVTGNYRHPNSLSGLAAGALPFFICLFKFQRISIKTVFLITIAGLLLIVLYTGSRTGYVATLMVIAAFILRYGIFKLKTIIVTLIALILLLTFIPESYQKRFETVFASGEKRGSSTGKRIEIIQDALAISAKYPLGVGVQAFPKVRGIEFGRHQDTHNLYLEVLTNLGPFGLIAFIIFLCILFKTNNTSRKTLLEKKQIFLAEICYVVNLYIFCRLMLGFFGMDLYEIYWWFAAGITMAMAKISLRVETNSSEETTADKHRSDPTAA